jgi:U3 small nucleolar RNA-associated protein 19
MPSLIDGAKNTKKRKNDTKESTQLSAKRRTQAQSKEDERSKVQELEEQISESRKYYNNIVTLISMFNVVDPAISPNLAVGVSLCRVFCRLLAAGHLNKPKAAAEQDLILVSWLRERYHEYQNALIAILRNAESSYQVKEQQK